MMATCYKCGDVLIPNEPCHNPQCKVSDTHAQSRGSEETAGESGSESIGERVEEDGCPHCGRRSGEREIRVSLKEPGIGHTVAHVRGIGVVSVEGTMSIRGQGLIVTAHEESIYVSYGRG